MRLNNCGAKPVRYAYLKTGDMFAKDDNIYMKIYVSNKPKVFCFTDWTIYEDFKDYEWVCKLTGTLFYKIV